MTWQEDFLKDDEAELRGDDDALLLTIRRIGGGPSWGIYLTDGSLAAVRPDKETAQAVATQLALAGQRDA